MRQVGTSAMVLAAGFGKRMRPLTLRRPKPLIEVAGKALIAHVFDRLAAGGVARAVVNVHYLGEQIMEWCATRAPIPCTVSDERDRLLDSGGGVEKALGQLGGEAFFIVNADSLWIDEAGSSALERMRRRFDERCMDGLLLVADRDRAWGYDGRGDFVIDDDGRTRRCGKDGGAVYAGVCMMRPQAFAGMGGGVYSLNRVWDHAIDRGRLFAMVHDGQWLHVGTPESVAMAESHLAGIAAGRS